MHYNAAVADKFVYVADPMCSWCWGFSPTLGEIRRRFAERFDFTFIAGGLRPGPLAQPLDGRLREYLRSAWRRVEESTGQPFHYQFLDRVGFVYDTEAGCRAVVTVRRVDPSKTFDYFARVQDGFYRRGLDPTDASVLEVLAGDCGVDVDAFRELFHSDALRTETEVDFETARRIGATGFPTTLVHDSSGWHLVSQGYFGPERIDETMKRWS